MLRYLAAIGMSKYTGSKAINDWMSAYVRRKEDRPVPFKWPSGERTHLEYVHQMGPFRLVMKACPEEGGVMRIYSALPCVRPGSFTHILNWELGLEDSHLVAFGEDEDAGGPMGVRMERTGLMMNLPLPQSGERAGVQFSALSVEGKIILGIERTEEDEKAYKEEEKWRQDMLEKMRSGDAEAMREMEQELGEQDLEIAERMKREDVFSVIEGFFMPMEDIISGVYQVLGTITDIDKAFNPETEEWVWHLELDVMGSGIDVYIHPDDLVGLPFKGSRFLGKVLLVGRLVL